MAKENKNEKKEEYRANLANLVDLVVDDRGTLVYLFAKEDGTFSSTDKFEQNGITILPPPKAKIPFLLPRPRLTEVLRWIKEDDNKRLFEDLNQYYKTVADLGKDEYYELFSCWVIHTYLLDLFKDINYSPILYIYADAEKGKTRATKSLIYTSFRGLYVECLREAYIFRVSNHLKVSIAFDVLDIQKKMEKAGSEDILLQRFERGTTVPRVNNPDRGPFEDTDFYEIFGATIITTNEPVNEILATRCIPFIMPQSDRKFNNDITPESALEIKERLTALRARIMFSELPKREKPPYARLGDIARPLVQTMALIYPEKENSFLKLIDDIAKIKKVEKAETLEAKILEAIILIADKVKDNILTVGDITEKVNASTNAKYPYNPKTIGKRLNALGFEKRRTSTTNCSAIVFDMDLLMRLADKYGLEACKQELSLKYQSNRIKELGLTSS